MDKTSRVGDKYNDQCIGKLGFSVSFWTKGKSDPTLTGSCPQMELRQHLPAELVEKPSAEFPPTGQFPHQSPHLKISRELDEMSTPVFVKKRSSSQGVFPL